ncbi:MAG: type III-A CRISPR-associated protein Csm2 [Desulfofustis sp. PB-SRB1]|jgi:CRISPR-associated protein Csm2|nr:type III-A CRISPR-associated protein Csm2 [Desulfofustis sp. PB-SRB1]HBH29887.1 type III-A CRISPR-associated protein Csm2 [Desulfofustis sp.]
MEQIKLWVDKEKQIVDPFLFSKIAHEKAREIDEDGRDHKNKEKQNGSSQLRRFFDEIARLNIKAQSDIEPWEFILPQVHMVVAKMTYAQGRELVTPKFVKLFGEPIRDQVVDKDDLRVYCSFFEAFIGFYKSYRRN